VKSIKFASLVVASFLGIVVGTLASQAQSARHRSEIAFVANQSSNNLSTYKIKSNGGLLGVSGSPFAAGGAPNSVSVVPSGRFAYVANVIPGSVTGFSVAQNGVVTPIPGSLLQRLRERFL
jgi:6-phosphogluconolactonase (cycloisomerase 2 family)